MAQKPTYNELVSIREMSRALMELADRLIQREQPPVSTGSCKKISQKEINRFYEHRAKARSRQMEKGMEKFPALIAKSKNTTTPKNQKAVALTTAKN
jgi:hypothetical protein